MPPKRNRSAKKPPVTTANNSSKEPPVIITVDDKSDDEIVVLHEDIKKKGRGQKKVRARSDIPKVNLVPDEAPCSSNDAAKKAIKKKIKIEVKKEIGHSSTSAEAVINAAAVAAAVPAVAASTRAATVSSVTPSRKAKQTESLTSPAIPIAQEHIPQFKKRMAGGRSSGEATVPLLKIKLEVKEEVTDPSEKEAVNRWKELEEAKKLFPDIPPVRATRSTLPVSNQVFSPLPPLPPTAATPPLAAKSIPSAKKKTASTSLEHAPAQNEPLSVADGRDAPETPLMKNEEKKKKKGKKKALNPQPASGMETESEREVPQRGTQLCSLLSVDPKILGIMKGSKESEKSITMEKRSEKEEEKKKGREEKGEGEGMEKEKEERNNEKTVEKKKKGDEQPSQSRRESTKRKMARTVTTVSEPSEPAAVETPEVVADVTSTVDERGVAPYVPPRFKKKKEVILERRMRQEEQGTPTSRPLGRPIVDADKNDWKEPTLFLFYVHKRYHDLESLHNYFKNHNGFLSVSIELKLNEQYASGVVKWRTVRDAQKFVDLGREHVIGPDRDHRRPLIVSKNEADGKNPRHLMIASAEEEKKKKERERERERRRREDDDRRRKKEQEDIFIRRYDSRSDERRRSRSRERRRSRSNERRRSRSRSGDRRRRRSRSRSREGRRRSRSSSRERRERKRKEEGEKRRKEEEEKKKEGQFISRKDMAKNTAVPPPPPSVPSEDESVGLRNNRVFTHNQPPLAFSRPSIILPAIIHRRSLLNTPLPPPTLLNIPLPSPPQDPSPPPLDSPIGIHMRTVAAWHIAEQINNTHGWQQRQHQFPPH